jgi:hypothetical protein
MLKKLLLTGAFASLLIAKTVKADDFSDDEKALLSQGMSAELFEPDKPHRHWIGTLSANGKSGQMVYITFGQEDAAPAREEGESMAEFHYTEALAEQFLFAEAWDKYKPDRFFTRAYLQVGMEAYEAALKKHRK